MYKSSVCVCARARVCVCAGRAPSSSGNLITDTGDVRSAEMICVPTPGNEIGRPVGSANKTNYYFVEETDYPELFVVL